MSNDYKQQKFLDQLASQIVHLRKAKGMTQEQLAGEAGIDRVALANIETGKRRPTVTTMYKIASGLKVDMATIFKDL